MVDRRGRSTVALTLGGWSVWCSTGSARILCPRSQPSPVVQLNIGISCTCRFSIINWHQISIDCFWVSPKFHCLRFSFSCLNIRFAIVSEHITGCLRNSKAKHWSLELFQWSVTRPSAERSLTKRSWESSTQIYEGNQYFELFLILG